jgi:hypothetical protein
MRSTNCTANWSARIRRFNPGNSKTGASRGKGTGRRKLRDTDGHGKDATLNIETRHARFPLSNFPLHAGERANESLCEFHVKDKRVSVICG